MRLILFAVKLFLFNFEGPVVCPPGWIPWNSMCYYFSSDSQSSKMSWQEALQACRRTRGGDLVSIHSASENIFIKSNITRWVVFNKTSHWFFKPLLCCSVCLGQFTIWATIFNFMSQYDPIQVRSVILLLLLKSWRSKLQLLPQPCSGSYMAVPNVRAKLKKRLRQRQQRQQRGEKSYAYCSITSWN